MGNPYTTYADAVRQALDFRGSRGADDGGMRDARRAVLAALRELGNAHQWRYYYKVDRFQLDAPYSAGAVAYDAASRVLTLSGGAWPAWAASGTLRVGQVDYAVDSRASDAELVLAADGAPPADLAAGSPYLLYRDAYPLPADFRAAGDGRYEGLFGPVRYWHPGKWLGVARAAGASGVPRHFTVLPDPKVPAGGLAAKFWPIPAEAGTLDVLYRRAPRPIRHASFARGTATIAQGSTTLALAAAAPTQATMVGAVVRLSADSVNAPTGLEGDNPAAFETTVAAVPSGTTLTLADPAPQAFAQVKYELSDPIDVEPGTMLTAFQRCVEWQTSLFCKVQDQPNPLAAWRRALDAARAADAPSFSGRVVGADGFYGQPIRAMPVEYAE